MKAKLFIGLFVILFLVGTVSAEWEWDNVRDYDPETRTITITNALGLGTELSKITLVTPDLFYVPKGYQKVAEFDVNSKDDYQNVFNSMEFLDMNDNNARVYRNFDYKILVKIGEEEVIDYATVCDPEKATPTSSLPGCTLEEVGSHIEDITEWQIIDQSNGLNHGTHKISIWTNVQEGDYIDWIPTLYGERIPEWAGWTTALTVGLKMYWTLNESSSPLIDSAPGGLHDSIGNILNPNFGFASGINASYTDFQETRSGVRVGPILDGASQLTANWSLSVWLNATTPNGTVTQIWGNAQGSPRFQIAWSNSSSTVAYESGVSTIVCSITGLAEHEWQHMALVRNTSGTHIYANGVLCGNTTGDDFPNTEFGVGCLEDGAPTCINDWFNGGIDEFSIWNRSLTTAEIENLATGITFGNGSAINPPGPGGLSGSVELLAPVNATLTSSTTLNFTANSTVLNGNLSNSTLRVWFINHTLHSEISNLSSGEDLTNTTSFTVTGLNDGTYVWNVFTNFSNFTDTLTNISLNNNTFTISTTAPILVIHQPVNNVFVFSDNLTVVLNYTVTSGGAVDTCFYHTSDNATNITVPCNLKTVVNFTSLTNKTKTIFVFANDTFNNLANNQTIFNLNTITTIVNKQTITEGDEALFTLTIDLTPGDIGSVANLTYNNTGFLPNFVFSNSTVFIAERTLSIPLGTGNTTGRNVSWNWFAGIVGALNIFSYSFAIYVEPTIAIRVTNQCTTQTIGCLLIKYDSIIIPNAKLNNNTKDNVLRPLIAAFTGTNVFVAASAISTPPTAGILVSATVTSLNINTHAPKNRTTTMVDTDQINIPNKFPFLFIFKWSHNKILL